MDKLLKKVFLTCLLAAVTLFNQGCMYLLNDGKASDDDWAVWVGIFGLICFWAGLKGDGNRPVVMLVLIGLALIFA